MNNNRNNNNNNNNRRGRGRPNTNRNQGGGNQANRIDSRARGNAPQLLDKYKKLAQDAQHNDDRVQAEYYLQFADHYFRVIADIKARQDEARVKRPDDRSDNDGDNDGNDGDDRRPNNRRPRARQDEQNDGGRDDRPAHNGRGNGRGRRDENDSDERSDNRSDGRSDDRSDDRDDSDGPRSSGRNGRDENPFVRDAKRPRKPRVAKPRRDDDDGHAEIDVSVLPPAIGQADDDTEVAPKPKRAPRRRKASDEDNVEAVG